MIGKRIILLRVQNFQKSRRRIAAEIAANFIYFVQHEYRVIWFRTPQTLDNPAGQCADISTAMSAYLRFIAYAAQRNAHEFAGERPGNGVSQRSLACSRRTHKTQNRSFGIRLQFAYGQIFDNTLFGLGQSVMIFVQNLSGCFNIQIIRSSFIPRQGSNPIQISWHDRIFSRWPMHVGKAFNLPLGFFSYFVRKILLFNFLTVFFCLCTFAFRITQLLLDSFQLLSQIVITLALIKIAFDLWLDFISQFQNFHLMIHQAR